jgi:uncharacterized protein (DUF362 family)
VGKVFLAFTGIRDTNGDDINMSIVAVKRCVSYAEIKNSLELCFELLGGMRTFVKNGDRVLIKPNLGIPLPPARAATTHPEIIRAIVELVMGAGATVTIGENSGGKSPGVTKRAFDMCGISDVASSTGAGIENFQEGEWSQVEIPGHAYLESEYRPKSLLEVDLIINVPKFKTHGITFITGALKNTFGCIPGSSRSSIHKKFKSREQFAQAVLDIYEMVAPHLTVVDAVVAMEGDGGPINGNPTELGLVLAGTDGVAADAVSAWLTGHDPMTLPIIGHAHHRGMGTGDLNSIEIRGDELRVAKDFVRNSLIRSPGKNENLEESYNTFMPHISEKCMLCGDCAANCPVNAISGNAKTGFTVVERKCIRCLICHEICVNGAVALRRM